MASREFVECLSDVYRGEQLGEVAFEGMLAAGEGPEQHYLLGTLLQLETEAKAMLRPLLVRCGLPLRDDPGAATGGAQTAEQMNALPWVERFQMLREIVNTTYLPRYRELGTLVSPDEDAETARIARFMGDHEASLVVMSDLVIAGKPDPAAPVAALLHFPLPRPE